MYKNKDDHNENLGPLNEEVGASELSSRSLIGTNLIRRSGSLCDFCALGTWFDCRTKCL